MKTIIKLIITIFLLTSCCVQHHLPSYTNQLVVKDTTVIKTELISIPLPSESHNIVTNKKESHLETSLAVSDASIDSTGLLHHSLANKKDSIKTKFIYKERYVYRDSLVKVEVPVEVEKIVEKKVIPTIYKYSLGFSIGVLIFLVLFLLRKFGVLKIF